MDSTTLEQRLKERLENHTYESSIGRGIRHLGPHHVKALIKDLMPFIKDEIEEAVATPSF